MPIRPAARTIGRNRGRDIAPAAVWQTRRRRRRAGQTAALHRQAGNRHILPEPTEAVAPLRHMGRERREMESTGDFFAMGGHGLYVWPAFAIAIGVLAAMALQAWLARRAMARLLEERDERLGQRRAGGRP